MRLLLLSVTLALGATPSLRAQDSFGFVGDRQTAEQLAHIESDAHDRGLPTDPIIAKVRRGVLIHAPSSRILAAARAVARRLEEARDALAPQPTAADIVAGEDALSIDGLSPDALRTIRAASPNNSLAVPIGVLTQLVASGVPVARATTIVTNLMRRGATNKQLVALGTDVNADVAHGVKADASLEVRLNGLTPFLPGASAQAIGVTAASPTGAGPPPKKP